MSIEQDKKLADRFPLEVVNQRKLNVLDEITAPNAVEHAVPPGMPPTVEGTKIFFGMMFAAFPDLKYTVEDTIGECDRVAQRVTAHGTMKGDFLGMPATGKSATWSEIHIIRLKDGKVVEHWGLVDQASMMTQTGFDARPEVN